MSAVSVQRSVSLNDKALMSRHQDGQPAGDVNRNDLIDKNGRINLKTVLPNQKVHMMLVHHSTPMMDLLLQVSKGCQLKPGEHNLVVVSEQTGRTVDYKSSQTIGSLKVNRVFLVSKAMQKKEREKERQRQRDLGKFEQTIRVTVNLPRGVRSLQRLNPNVPLFDIYKRICQDKGLDASMYELRITRHPHRPVDLSLSLNDYAANEITIKNCSAPAFHSSMIDISRAVPSDSSKSQDKMADPLEKVRKKRGLFSFLKKDKKPNRQPVKRQVNDDTDYPSAWKRLDESRSASVQALPVHGDVMMSKPHAQIKSHAQVHATINEENEDDENKNKVKKPPSKKKHKAPEPPNARPLSTFISVKEERDTPMYASTPNLTTTPAGGNLKKSRRHPLEVNHSRHSSDSSGYHEPPLTPPDSASSPSNSGSLPKNSSKASIPSAKVTSPVQRTQTLPPAKSTSAVQRTQTLPPSSNVVPTNRKNKKKAPTPPALSSKANQAPFPPILHNKSIIESEDEAASLSSHNDDTPELGIESTLTKPSVPPIFIPPPPPESPPPAISESRQETRHFTDDSPDVIQKEFIDTLNEPDRLSSCPITIKSGISSHSFNIVAPQHYRSDSRCSRTSVNTIDDVQLCFEIAIAAGEKQLQNEEGSIETSDKRASSEETNNMAASPDEAEPSETDVNAAFAEIDKCLNDDDTSDGSLVPDGEKYTAVDSIDSQNKNNANTDRPTGSVRSVTSLISHTGSVKPVEEISYGESHRFENPFRGSIPIVQFDEAPADRDLTSTELMKRRDSQISDSTLPDSEHTDRLQSSSGLQSDDNDSVTETGDGYDTTGTEKVSHSETENSHGEFNDEPTTYNQYAAKSERRGLFVEVKGHDVNEAIYGDTTAGSIRGVPGQVKDRAASFGPSQAQPDTKQDQTRPKSILNLLTNQRVTSDAPKKKTVPVKSEVDVSRHTAREAPNQPASNKSDIAPATRSDSNAIPADTESNMSSKLYSKPLPVYSRMTQSSFADRAKTIDRIPNRSSTSDSVSPQPLASVIADSVKTGEASKSMKRVPDSGSSTMFFRASRSSRADVPQNRIENVIKLDSNNLSYASLPRYMTKEKSSTTTSQADDRQSATVSRKESLKDQYNKLQENMARWQSKLKDNETRVKELTSSQQNLSSTSRSSPNQISQAQPMPKSTSVSDQLSKQTFGYKDKAMYQSVPNELNKVSLKSAAHRVIKKKEPELDPVERLMQSIRQRGGRTSEKAPERGIYVADGRRNLIDDNVAVREIAPTVLESPVNSNSFPPPPPPPPPPTLPKTNGQMHRSSKQQNKMVNGSHSRPSDPRFNPAPSMRDNLLAEITNAKGKPASRRRTAATESSSSQSSSDELREIEVRHKPQRTSHAKSKRSISDPFPPQGPNSRHNVQPTPTELDPREELMIAVRNFGGLNKLHKVDTKEISEVKWSTQV